MFQYSVLVRRNQDVIFTKKFGGNNQINGSLMEAIGHQFLIAAFQQSTPIAIFLMSTNRRRQNQDLILVSIFLISPMDCFPRASGILVNIIWRQPLCIH
jgi:hypothetical protein